MTSAAQLAPQGVITETDRKFVETWENVASYVNSIIRLDPRGVERQEMIERPRTFMITTEERVITQDRIVNPKRDPFLNGAFRPIVVPDSVSVTSNPNSVSDEEIKNILVSSDIAFTEWLKVIDSPQTLARMVEIADDTESMTLKRYKVLAHRLAEVKPKTRITQKDQERFDAMGGVPAADSANKRQQGGRSQDYRPS